MKLLTWNGKNKKFVREQKAEIALKYYKPGSQVISLPGATCSFEKLISKGGVPADKIIGIQSVYSLPNHSGEEVFKILNKNKSSTLNKMEVWPGDVLDFFKRLRRGKIKNSKIPKRIEPFLNEELFKKEINNISIIDLDLCGIFSKRLLDIITEIFKTKALNKHFTLFVNVQKGRDVRGGKLFKLISNRATKTEDLEEIRYFYFPYIILNIGKEFGYLGNVLNLFEYADKNGNNAGVSMLQFAFHFRKSNREIPNPVRRAGYYYYEKIDL